MTCTVSAEAAALRVSVTPPPKVRGQRPSVRALPCLCVALRRTSVLTDRPRRSQPLEERPPCLLPGRLTSSSAGWSWSRGWRGSASEPAGAFLQTEWTPREGEGRVQTHTASQGAETGGNSDRAEVLGHV